MYKYDQYPHLTDMAKRCHDIIPPDGMRLPELRGKMSRIQRAHYVGNLIALAHLGHVVLCVKAPPKGSKGGRPQVRCYLPATAPKMSRDDLRRTNKHFHKYQREYVLNWISFDAQPARFTAHGEAKLGNIPLSWNKLKVEFDEYGDKELESILLELEDSGELVLIKSVGADGRQRHEWKLSTTRREWRDDLIQQQQNAATKKKATA